MIIVLAIGLSPVQVAATAPTPGLHATRFSLPGLATAAPLTGTDVLVARGVPRDLVAPAVNEDAIVRASEAASAPQRPEGETPVAVAVDGSQTVRAATEQQDKTAIFLEYNVQTGDTLSGIAARFGIRTDYIVWNNADLTNANALAVGQTLQIPSVEGIVHSVRVGDTVTDIAARYEASARDIIEFRPNGLAGDPNSLREGSQILVPGGRKADAVPAAAAAAAATPEPAPAATATVEAPAPAATPSRTPPPQAVVTAQIAVPTAGWSWPVQGLMTSRFGPSHPLGIDVAAPVGTPIVAAASGTVSFVGGNPCCSYGYHIIIDHGSGYETLYAHLGQFTVERGERVAAGQRIGSIGMTGLSTGPHLHFELHRSGAIQNPMQYLP